VSDKAQFAKVDVDTPYLVFKVCAISWNVKVRLSLWKGQSVQEMGQNSIILDKARTPRMLLFGSFIFIFTIAV